MVGAGRAALAVARDRHALRFDALGDQIRPDRVGPALPQPHVVLVGAPLVGVPAEAFTDLHVELRRRFPDLAIIVTNDTDGTYNYLPPAAYYGNGAYEQDCADFGPGALEIVTMEASRLIQKLTAETSGASSRRPEETARQDSYTWT